MSLFKAFLFALPLAVSNAKPLYPSKVVRRDTEPSSFPLGDACGNEWQYLNFDPNNDGDKARLQKLHDVICIGELRAIAARGAYSATQTDNIYKLYFDEDPEVYEGVDEVLMMIAGSTTAGSMVGDVVAGMIVDNNDFGGDEINCASNSGAFAYTDTDDNDDREKIHFCDMSFDLPTAAPDIYCSGLDWHPSWKMDTFSRVVLHETLHYSTVGPASSLGSLIVDQFNDDGEPAYGPDRAHGLQDPDQDDQPGKAEINADNFAWMALQGWVSYVCTDGRDDYSTYIPDAPPNYS